MNFEKIIEELSKRKSVEFYQRAMFKLAEVKELPEDMMEEVVKQAEKYVKEEEIHYGKVGITSALLKNPTLTEEQHIRILDARIAYERETLESKDIERIAELLESDSTVPETMETLKVRKDEIIFELIYKIRGGKVPPEWAEDKDTTHIVESMVEGAFARYERRIKGEEVSRKTTGISREEYLEEWKEFHEEYWQEFMEIEDSDDRENEIIGDEYELKYYREYIEDPNTPSEILEKIYDLGIEWLRDEIVRHPNLSEEFVKKIHETGEYEHELLVKEELPDKLADEIFESLKQNGELTDDELLELARIYGEKKHKLLIGVKRQKEILDDQEKELGSKKTGSSFGEDGVDY